MRWRNGWPPVAAAAGLAVTAPVLVLHDWGARPASSEATAAPAIAAPEPAPELRLDRALFATEPVAEAEDPSADRPVLVGVVGRLPDDAVALVRTPDGDTRSLAVGQDEAGWTLEALDVDGARFRRDGERLRLALPTGP